jgi:polysaccharide biosynthesis transport protein
MDLINFLKVLLKRKWLIATITLIAVVSAFFITKITPEKYKSQTQLATGITDTGNEEDNKAYVQPLKIENQFNNLLELLNSRQVINLLSYQLILHDLDNSGSFRSMAELKEKYPVEYLDMAREVFLEKYSSMKTLVSSNDRDRMLIDMLKIMGYDFESIQENLEVERVFGTDYVGVNFSSENPFLSAFVVNTLSQEFLRYYKTVKGEKSHKTIEFYEDLTSQKKKELDDKVDELKQYKLDNNIVNIDEQIRSIVAQIRTLEMEREEENKKIPAIQKAIAKINRRFNGEDEESYLEAHLSKENIRILELREQIKDLNERYISGGFENQLLADSITMLKSQLSRHINQSASEHLVNPTVPKNELVSRKINLEIELEIAKESLISLDNELSRLRNKVSSFALQEAVIASYEREINVASDAYLNALDKLNSAKVASLNSGSLLKQVEFGQPADKPEPSKRMVVIALAGMVSFALCVVGIFVTEYLDVTIKNPVQFQKFTNLELAGALNSIPEQQRKLEAFYQTGDSDPKLELYKQMLKKLRYEIEASRANTLLVTSLREGEGKSFLLVSLAYALSLNEAKILLVDTNFKNNSLTKMFNARPVFGKFLNKEGNGDEALVTSSGFKNIDVIGCEGGNYSPSEIFSNINLGNILSELRKEYDYIFLEGAALNEYSDTKELVNYVDKIIPVFSSRSDIKYADENSIEYLHSLEDKLLGSVLNHVDLDHLKY